MKSWRQQLADLRKLRALSDRMSEFNPGLFAKLAQRRAMSEIYLWWHKHHGCEIEQSVRMIGRPIIERFPESSIKIGARTRLVSVSDRTALGVSHPVVIRTMDQASLIEIGEDVGISGGTICAQRRVVIGAKTMLGADVIIADTDFHPVDPYERLSTQSQPVSMADPVEIGRNVFVGTRSIVLKGVKVGDNSVIGAGSVVVNSIPANSVAAGVPARVVKRL